MISLPVDEVLPDVAAALRAHGAAVLVAPPGAGKTTRVPPALLEAGLAGDDGRVVVLQPRRVAARMAARRIAAERGWRVGGRVGWRIRFERRVGPETRIELVTEGLLTRRLQDDPFLEGVGVVVLDELHERSLHADLALGMLLEVRAAGRDDLRVLAMSATLDPGPVAELLGGAPVVRSEGRLHPVDVRYAERADDAPVHVRCARAVRRILAETPAGHMLVFLPGVSEIARTAKALSSLEGVDILPLHGRLPPAEQERALRPSERRKVVLSTNVAETSVTLDGVAAVVDSGLVLRARFDPAIGLTRLETRPVAKDSADQRAGRAGRTGPGRCERLWTRGEHAGRPERTQPEVRRADLAGALLELKAWGADPRTFSWLDPPPPAALADAERVLAELGALDESGGITGLGRQLAKLPLPPRLGRVVVAGHAAGILGEAARQAARMADDRDPDPVARQLMDVARSLLGDSPRREATDRAIFDALAAGFPGRVGRRRGARSARIRLADGRGAVLDEALDKGELRDVELLFAVTLTGARRGERAEHRIRAALPVEEAWLDVEEREVVEWDPEREAVVGRLRRVHGELVLDERPSQGRPDPALAAELLAERAKKEPEAALGLTDADRRLLARLRWAAQHAPGEGLEATADLDSVVGELSVGRRSFAELRAVDLPAWLLGRLTWAQRSALDAVAPKEITLPRGRRPRRLEYQADGPPILAARIQDFFGMADTPRVARGAVPVLLHLLAPNGRPAQVTQDLASFWSTGYAAVRKELRGRYPKHDWPESPL